MSLIITQDYKIVVSAHADEGTKYAACELQKYLKAIGGIELCIVSDSAEPMKREIVIGRTNRFGTPSGVNLKNDGYVLRTLGDSLFISGMNDRGNLYGVYGLLEKYLNVRFFTASLEKVPASDIIELPELDDAVVPPFEYRRTSWHEVSENPAFAYKRGINSMAGTSVTPILALRSTIFAAPREATVSPHTQSPTIWNSSCTA